MDMCGPMRVKSINGKKYIMVIIDDYSRFTWVKLLRSENEAPENTQIARRPADRTSSPVSTYLEQDAPSTRTSSTQEQEHSPIISQCVEESPKTPHFHDDPLHETLHEESTS
ncbi:retrovirus-related pol polyprotein from transposon TNT 1-94 [Tanacetum coccineum]